MGKLGAALSVLREPESQENMSFNLQTERERLFELALNAGLPRCRELKSWEPQRLNEAHIAMIMARAGGMRQRDIATAFSYTDSQVSIILNHPDAEYLLARLQAMKAGGSRTDIEARLAALSERAVGALEDLFEDEEISPLKLAPHAFRVLENNGYSKPKEVEVRATLGLGEASASQLGQLTKALRDATRIQDANVVDSIPLLPPAEV